MTRVFTFILVCVVALFSVGCSQNNSVKDISGNIGNNYSSTTTDVPVDPVIEELPTQDVVQEQEGTFDPDSYEDKEIDDLIGLLEGLVEG